MAMRQFVLYLEVCATMAMRVCFVFRSMCDYGYESVLYLEVCATIAMRLVFRSVGDYGYETWFRSGYGYETCI